jgi:hypothetical protein
VKNKEKYSKIGVNKADIRRKTGEKQTIEYETDCETA